MKNTFLGAIVVALGLGATVPLVSWAQDQQPQAQEQMRRGGRGFGGPGRPGGPGGRMGGPMGGAIMRDLTDAQREQAKGIHERHAERIRPLAERVHAAREAVQNAILSGNTGNLQALSIEVGNAETELTFAQAQVQSEILSILTAEQKQKIAERRKQMEERRGDMLKRRQQRQ
ncbi:MAG TPA: periplasmic heavy metal sensor [Vicinamibacterales bacterium]|nr:periplasmic heavy metal sensor [Vicinamibacterales bacterium]